MCTGKAVSLLGLTVIVFASAAPNSITFHRTLQYSQLNETDQNVLESFLQTAARELNEYDGETFMHITNAIALNLGLIFSSFRKLNATKEFRCFVDLTATEKGFESKLETALAKTNFADVEVLQNAGANLQTTLSPKLKYLFNGFMSLDVTEELLRRVTEVLTDLNENDRVLAVGALRIILKKNVLKYVPPRPKSVNSRRTSSANGKADLLHKSFLLLALTISSKFLFYK